MVFGMGLSVGEYVFDLVCFLLNFMQESPLEYLPLKAKKDEKNCCFCMISGLPDGVFHSSWFVINFI